MDTLTNPIFIVGCPRSGTTLLQQILNAHPEVAIAPETHFIEYFWKRRKKYGELSEDSNYYSLIKDITTLNEFVEMGLSADNFFKIAWSSDRSYAILFQLLLKQFAIKQNATIVGEKTPNHVLHLSTLKDFFPSARFVHLVRDPRAVVNSWRSIPWSSGSTAGDARLWRGHILSALRSPYNIKSSLFTLSYEQLVVASEENLRLLCDFLNLQFNPVMLNYFQKQISLVSLAREPWKARIAQPISNEPMTSWKKELSEQMITEIESIVWWEMRHFGYKAQTPLIKLLPAVLLNTAQRKFKRIWKI